MKIKSLISSLEKQIPLNYSLDWDNCGLQVGDNNLDISNVAVALTPTVDIIKSAIESDCNLLITHHPLIFSPLKAVDFNDHIGKAISLAIKSNLTIYTMHTNFDSLSDGLNFEIAKDIGLDNIKNLSITKNVNYLKLIFFSPADHTINIISEISNLGFGCRDNFSHFSYVSDGSVNYINKNNDIKTLSESNQELEQKIELVIKQSQLEEALIKLKEVHPYNDFVYDVYKLENKEESIGIGTIGDYLTPFSLNDVVEMVKDKLNVSNIRFVGDKKKAINRVAICTGSGASFLKLAKQKSADLLLTGDIKYHDAIDASEMGISLIDAGHYATEIICVPFFKKLLKNITSEDFEVVELKEKDPFSYL